MMSSTKNILFFIYFTILLIIESCGFYLTGGENWSWIDSIYMTIITLSTVGFTEVHSLSDGERIWAMFVITFGIIGYGILFYHLKDAFIHLDIY